MSLYKQVLELITPYFDSPIGAEVFLVRQCKQHLNREPANLGPHDLWNLAKWTMVSGGLLLSKQKAEEMSHKILDLRKSMGSVPLPGQ
jgi:hypothetical protein